MNTATAKTDRYSNRAPRGGAVSPVISLFYKGGQFMPMVAAVIDYKPLPLMGSVRQIAWANRLRAAALAALDEIQVRRLFLVNPSGIDARATRQAIRKLMFAHHGLMTERSASVVIDRRALLA